MDISPNGHYICLGLFDQTLRIYNNISYTCVTVLEHEKTLLDDITVNYYKEEMMNNEGETKYIQLKPPIDLKRENLYIARNNYSNDKSPKIGVSKMAFSFDNFFLATKNDNMPNIVFIWDLNQMNLQSVLIHLNEVVFFQWAKNQNILFISTNNNKLYYFSLDTFSILQLAPDFQNKSLIFSSNGKKLMVKDTNNFIMVNIENQNEEEENSELVQPQTDQKLEREKEEKESEKSEKKSEKIEKQKEDEFVEEYESNNGEEHEEQIITEGSNPKITFDEEIGMSPDS
jgi:WD40 repeat protein